MEQNNLVSIIVPIYNTSKYLRKCLDSICVQTYKNLEIILVDDGSTDNSAEIIDEYQKKDSRIVAIHQTNGGQSNARNTGIRMARGEFLSFIDGDDEIAPDFILDLVQAIGKENALAITGMHYKHLKQNRAEDVYIRPIHARKNNESMAAYVLYLLTVDGRLYSSVNKLYRAGTIKEHEINFQEDLNFAEDTKFVLDYLKVANGEIAFVLKPYYVYNSGTETSTIKKSGVSWENWQNSYDNLKSWVGENPTWREKMLLKTVLLRWKIAHKRTIQRAKA